MRPARSRRSNSRLRFSSSVPMAITDSRCAQDLVRLTRVVPDSAPAGPCLRPARQSICTCTLTSAKSPFSIRAAKRKIFLRRVEGEPDYFESAARGTVLL